MSVTYKVPEEKFPSFTEIKTQEQLHNIIKKGGRVLVDVSARWCSPCKAIAPRYKELSEMYGEKYKIRFLKLDEKVNDEYFQIRGFPTFYFIEKGNIFHTIIGADIKDVERRVLEFWAN